MSGSAAYNTATSFLDRGELSQAREAFATFLDSYPSSLEGVFGLADAELQTSGRSAASEALLKFARRNWGTMSSAARQALRNRVNAVNQIFVTDAAQTAYLQARVLARNSGCLSALPALRLAYGLEAGNSVILQAYLDCVRSAGDRILQGELSRAMLDLDPWNRAAREDYIFLLLRAQEYKEVVTVYESSLDALTSPRIRTAYGMALYETGQYQEAIPPLREVLDRHGAPSVAQFYLASSLSESGSGNRSEMTILVRRFLSSFVPIGPIPTDAFRTDEKIGPARNLLTKIWAS